LKDTAIRIGLPANLYAEDVVIQWPLAVPAPVIVRGHQSLQKALQDGWKLLELRASNIKVHETLDPEVVIAEYEYDGKTRDTGKVFRSANILVLTVRNGRIIN
jgi:ketosteroid isomerase-like protein